MLNTRRTTFLTMIVFGLQPFALGAWLALIPQVKAALALSKADLALCLLGMPLALIPMLQLASRGISRFGPRRVLMASFPVIAVSFALPLLAGGPLALFGALAVNGAVMAFMQAGLNVYAGRFEKSSGLIVMGRCHGAWALGLMAGSLLVTVVLAMSVGVSFAGTTFETGFRPVQALLIVAVPSGAMGVVVAWMLPKLEGDDGGAVPARRKLSEVPPALYYISAFAFAVAITEGAMSDWAAVHLAERLPAGATYAGIAVSIYAGCLAAGRFAGDYARRLAAAPVLARGSVGLAIGGLLCLVLPLPLVFVYAGYALIGLGASVGFPLAVSAVAQLDDTYEAANIAMMSMIAIAGFLVGPPLIGFLAEMFGLRIGLAALIPILAAGIILAGWLRGANQAR